MGTGSIEILFVRTVVNDIVEIFGSNAKIIKKCISFGGCSITNDFFVKLFLSSVF